MLTIDPLIARRFVLGKQGLWPGRRWRGTRGVEAAMRACEYVQLDPLQIIARSQDLMLHSRVHGYRPGDWETQAYEKRKFFDWGGWLAVRPMDELPYVRALMRREREAHRGVLNMQRQHAQAIDEMRAVLRARDTVSNRDFEPGSRQRTVHYRGRKDSAVALYYLWRVGEAMVHHRERFERVYAHSERIVPAQFQTESSDAEADVFLLKKLVSFYGLSPLTSVSGWLSRTVSKQALEALRTQLLRDRHVLEVRVDGWRATQFALATDEPLLKSLTAGRVPRAWRPAGTTNESETLFLAPLDVVSARGRAKQLFQFDYVWEVYKPLHARKWGYYTLPILWGDALVGRFDSKLDRTSQTLVMNGLWLEEARFGKDEAFAAALGAGMRSFVKFLGAHAIDAKAVRQPLLRKQIKAGGAL